MRLFPVFATAQAAIGDGNQRSFVAWENCINGGHNLINVLNAEENCTGNACSIVGCFPGYHRVVPTGAKKERRTFNGLISTYEIN